MRTWIGIVLGVVIGFAIIYMPLLIRQAMVPNSRVSGTRDEKQDLASTKGEGIEGERSPILVAIVGLGVVIAYATYLLARGRKFQATE